MLKPRQALHEAGAQAQVVAPNSGNIQGWNHDQKGVSIPVDRTLAQANPDEFDGLLLPGGVMNPDTLRTIPDAVRFVRAFAAAGKPIAAICHGPWMLVEAGLVRGKTVTSWPSLRTDIANAGGQWVDQQVAVDDGLVTSRKPDDIPAFNEQMITLFAAGTAGWGGEKQSASSTGVGQQARTGSGASTPNPRS